MLKKLLFVAGALFFSAVGAMAQIITTDPSPLQEDAENITIYFHADQGNKGLMGLPASEKVFAHTGVITDKSKGDSDWKYATPDWGNNSDKYLLTYVSPNLYKLEMASLRAYYGVPATETIKKLAFVFRNSNSSKTGRTASGGDILVDVLDGGFQVALTSSLGEETVLTPLNCNNIKFTLGSTEAANLTLSVNGAAPFASANNVTALEGTTSLPAVGTYEIVGKAVKSDGTSVSTTVRLVYPTSSTAATYPGGVPKMGAVDNGNGSVTFCLAAPGKNTAILVGSWTDFEVSNDYVMNYQDYNGFRYFWITVNNVDPTKQYLYYYLVDSTYRIGDPYARLILDPYSDKWLTTDVYPNLPEYPVTKIPSSAGTCVAVYQGNFNDYNWTDKDFKIPNKTDLIVYELLLRDFTGTEGKAEGNGTVKKALGRLPYLKDLGVNVIELLPINEFDGNNSWGYNPNFYFAVDKAYGTPQDYKDFINACHENGIAVVLDMVFNQSSGLHPWYQLYPSSSNPFYNQIAPHAYSVLNDWNQGYPLVQEQWKDVVQYWINEFHVDGYRFDLVKGLGNNDSYANNGDAATNAYNKSRVENMHRIQKWIEEVKPDALFINENLAGAQEENEMAAFGQLNWSNINDPGCQYAMGYESNASLNGMLATNYGRTWGSTISYLESHDEQRLAYKQNQWGVAGVKGNLAVSMNRISSAAAQMILAPGSHMIWQFSELGNDENTKDNNGGNNTDPKKVLWNYLSVPERFGLFMNYVELIDIRLSNPELFAENAGYQLDYSGWAGKGRYFHSNAAGKELHLLVNPSVNQPLTMNVTFSSANEADYEIKSKSYGTEPVIDFSQGKVTIPANAYVVIGNTNVLMLGVDDVVAESEPVSETYYTLTGARVQNPDKGIYVKVVTYANGTSRSFKVIK